MISFVSASKFLLILCHQTPILVIYYLLFRYRWAHHLCFLSMNDLSRSLFFDLSILDYHSQFCQRKRIGYAFKNAQPIFQNKSKKEDQLKSFIERKQRWWAHLYLNSKYQNKSLWDDSDTKLKIFLEAETKEIIGKTHRTNKLVISKLVSTRFVHK